MVLSSIPCISSLHTDPLQPLFSLTAVVLQPISARTSYILALCRGVSPADFGPAGGPELDELLHQLMEAHQPQASPTSRDTLSALPRRKVRQSKDQAASDAVAASLDICI